MGSIMGEEENVDTSLLISTQKYKRRKVSAVRDFPLGCGPNAASVCKEIKAMGVQGVDRLNVDNALKNILKDIESRKEIGGDFREAESKGLLEQRAQPGCLNGVELKASRLATCGEVKYNKEELNQVSAENPNTSEELQFFDKNTLRDEKHDSSNDLMGVTRLRLEFPSTLKNAGEVDPKECGGGANNKMGERGASAEQHLPRHYQIPSNHVRKERKYPAPRRVSAVRDFPAGCGRNLTCPVKSRQVVEVKTDTKMDEAGELNQSKGDLEEDDNCADRIQDTQEMRSGSDEGVAVKMIMQAPIFVQSSEIKDGEKQFEDNNHEQLMQDIEYSRHGGKDESDVGSLPDRLKNDIRVYVKVKDKKEKSVGLFSNAIESQEVRIVDTEIEKGVIVLGLMSAASCPWRQMKAPAKLSPPPVSAKESKVKKDGKFAQDRQKRSGSDEGVAVKMIMQAPILVQSSDIKDGEKQFEDNNHEPFMQDNEDESDFGSLPDRLKNDIKVYVKDKDKKEKSVGLFSNTTESQEVRIVDTEIEKGVIVLGLMSATSCPWRQMKAPAKLSPSPVSANESKGEKDDKFAQDRQKRSHTKCTDNADKLAEKTMMIVPYLNEMEACDVPRPLALEEDEDSSENEEYNDFQFLPRSNGLDVTLPPVAGSSSKKGARSKVRDTLRLFQVLVRKLLQGEETKSKEKEKSSKRVDIRASNALKANGKFINTDKGVGAVPGVEIGDIFSYRVELAIIGLHGPLQSGIDTMKQGKLSIATSVVASGGYDNDVDSSDVLIYTGQGGNPTGVDKQREDQKLERGNLALKNCIDSKSPVRVIRGFKEAKPADNGDGRSKLVATYTYDGLYTVERYWQDLGPHGKLVYKFELRRNPGQHQLAWKEVKQSKKYKVREGCCVDDISKGKEKPPICAVNPIDDEKPPPFTYITSMMYPDWCRPIPLQGCDCKGGCSDSDRCTCTVKNGGEIPYNLSGAIVEAKPLVYECGPFCKCPPSCPNRVSQHGIRLPLEIFKTESRGWGVRSLSSIPSGSFICEYIGELLDDKEAEQRVGTDEYLFDIGQNFNDTTLSNGLSALIPEMPSIASDVVENIGFTIDAATYGNIGRFINHSCSPNLYAQNVLYDHEDKRIPHIMLFAAENIPPLQELTYHYNYSIDEVFDSKGNIKKKYCYCGSAECSGRMY